MSVERHLGMRLFCHPLGLVSIGVVADLVSGKVSQIDSDTFERIRTHSYIHILHSQCRIKSCDFS